MLCEKCNENTATVHMTRFINGKKTELHLCQKCARHRGDMNIFNPFTINDLLAGLLDMASPSADMGRRRDAKCDTCNMSYSQFKKVSRLGCEDCYRSFRRELEPILKRIQSGTSHTGKVPSRMGFSYRLKREIDQLKIKLQKAVDTEAFEDAAQIRDEIRRLERELREKREEGQNL